LPFALVCETLLRRTRFSPVQIQRVACPYG